MNKKKKYDIAFSYAGEDREYVEKVAKILRQAGVSVFYDKFEEATLWGKDLYIYLHQVYRDNSNFTVIFCSHSYAEKRWTTHELKSAQERAFRENSEYILPARFDDTEIPGIAGTVGYIDLRGKSPQDFCRILVEKLGFQIQIRARLKSSKPLRNKKPKSPRLLVDNNPRRSIKSFKEQQIKEIAEALNKDPFVDLIDILYCCPRCGSPRIYKPEIREISRYDEAIESSAHCADCEWEYSYRYWHCYRRSGYEQTLEGTIHNTNPVPSGTR